MVPAKGVGSKTATGVRLPTCHLHQDVQQCCLRNVRRKFVGNDPARGFGSRPQQPPMFQSSTFTTMPSICNPVHVASAARCYRPPMLVISATGIMGFMGNACSERYAKFPDACAFPRCRCDIVKNACKRLPPGADQAVGFPQSYCADYDKAPILLFLSALSAPAGNRHMTSPRTSSLGPVRKTLKVSPPVALAAVLPSWSAGAFRMVRALAVMYPVTPSPRWPPEPTRRFRSAG